MGWVSSAALREAKLLKRLLNLASFSRDGAGVPIGLVDESGNPVTLVGATGVTYNSTTGYFIDTTSVKIEPKVFSWGSQPFYPWDVVAGTRILIDPASILSGLGMTRKPIELVSDGVDVWMPYGEQILYSTFGSYASPADSLGAQNPAAETPFAMGGSKPIIPYQLLYKGIGIRVKWIPFKNDSDASTTLFRLRMGTNSTTGGDIAVQENASSGAASELEFDNIFRVTTLGAAATAKFTSSGKMKRITSATKTTNQSNDLGTNFSTMVNDYIVFLTTPPNTSATAAIRELQISLVP